MDTNDFDPSDISRSSILKRRVEAVRATRLKSTKASTQQSAATPHLFQEIRQPATDYVGIPRVVSETRRYYTVARLGAEVIAADSVFTAEDPDGLMFSLISSSMFMAWQRTVGGRLKSDLRFAQTLTWNTFPAPDFAQETRDAVIQAGEKVLRARELHPERSLAQHYHPLAMEPSLVRAHDELDRVVDRAFGAERKLRSEEQRLELLFSHYAAIVNQE